MEEQSGAKEHGKRRRMRGGHRQTCYDFDDGAVQAVVQVRGDGRRWDQHEKQKQRI